jgi:hypothetical protein
MDSVVSPIEGKKPQVLVPESKQPWVTQLLCSLVLLSASQQKVLNATSYGGTWDEKLGSGLENLEPWANPQLVAKILYKTWDFALNVCHQLYIIFLAFSFSSSK